MVVRRERCGVSDIVIRRLDPRDDGDMDGFQEVYTAAELAEDPDAALYSREDGVAVLTQDGAGRCGAGFGAFTSGGMVGELLVTTSELDRGAPAMMWVWVHPEHQRLGIGTLLAQRGHDHARSAGVTTCQAQARIGTDRDNGNVRFGRSLGYTLANTEVERRLALPCDLDRLEGLARSAEPQHRHYELRTVIGPVPDDLAESYVALKNRLAVEAPSGDLDVAVGQDTVAELAAQDRHVVAAGRTRVGTYALDAAGAVVGYSVAGVSNDRYHHVDQWGTLVDPRHRGHRLGLAVKCRLLGALSEHFATKRFITTTNAETNRHMVAINEALGFEVAHVWGDFQKQLARSNARCPSGTH
jgi:GNAT superfamily N-acetyltransferase